MKKELCLKMNDIMAFHKNYSYEDSEAAAGAK